MSRQHSKQHRDNGVDIKKFQRETDTEIDNNVLNTVTEIAQCLQWPHMMC